MAATNDGERAGARILLTGPVGRIDDYARAARAAGWTPHALPLVEIVPGAPRDGEAQGDYDWIAVTSTNALAYLGALLERRPALARVPAAVVGERSAERLRTLGLAVALPPARDAEELAERLVEASDARARVLWPRGPLASELGEQLAAAGHTVDAPLAYERRELAGSTPLPAARAVFFASPSAVHGFSERYAGRDEVLPGLLGVAIGRTTFDALLGATALGLCDTISLSEPTPEGLRATLEHVDVGVDVDDGEA